MASTTQSLLTLPWRRKRKKMRSRAVQTQSWCNGKRMDDERNSRRAFLKFGANLLRTFDPIERCRADQRFLRRKLSRLCFRTANDAGRSLARQNGGLASAIAPKLPRSIICLAARRPTISLWRDSGPWPAFFPEPRQTPRSVLGLWPARWGARRQVSVMSRSTRTARIERAPHWRS